jgi:hypothetical protein
MAALVATKRNAIIRRGLSALPEVPIPFALAMWPCPTVFPAIE